MYKISIGIIIAFVLAFGGWLITPTFLCKPIPAYQTIAISEAKQVGLALKLYAEKHAGTLPHSFEDLVPEYLEDHQLMRNMNLATPSAKLHELGNSSVIAFKSLPEDTRRVVVVRPDISIETIRP